ncbi:hypothetical protein JCGZ_02474 [Jatropha curcas]|uniref:Uncharacterized protein n=1 Tax=Jatropha curcas TaxID=180498 RepID=A0A067JDZ4_JATCU|nr:hypothetical protein JCGZ_02474 [Jatropha curcas]
MDGERKGKEGDEEDEDKDENGKVKWFSRVGHQNINDFLCETYQMVPQLSTGYNLIPKLDLLVQVNPNPYTLIFFSHSKVKMLVLVMVFGDGKDLSSPMAVEGAKD